MRVNNNAKSGKKLKREGEAMSDESVYMRERDRERDQENQNTFLLS